MGNYEEILRTWARGILPLEAATEMLIRAGFASEGRPWVKRDEARGWWIDFESIPLHVGVLSGGQSRFLLIASSLAGSDAVVLGDNIVGLDRAHLELVLAAISHAGGWGETNSTFEFIDNVFVRVDLPALFPWPEDADSATSV